MNQVVDQVHDVVTANTAMSISIDKLKESQKYESAKQCILTDDEKAFWDALFLKLVNHAWGASSNGEQVKWVCETVEMCVLARRDSFKRLETISE